MTFAELMALTAQATPDAPVRVRTADGDVLDITDVEIPAVDLDEGKKLGDVAEGFGRGETVWLVVE